ncbi:O-antigen ligase family protein [Aliifodinibius salicampi]|uniref:O-antigen ligase family protein n=1 Tax=Fodinibius salicampi TaxID=1920655 RepID=A0ABT3PV42_9BACT|nr:O-antigen ligase family protein [Fodinibius salicampi]MCW9711720.1 O-antigen ligase family protein [Fodinibius salicampi]
MNRKSALTSLFGNQTLVACLLIWLGSSIILGGLSPVIVIATALLLAFKRRYLELFIGFAFLLFVADSRQDIFVFAKNSRDVYAVIMTLCIVFDKQFPIYRKFYNYFLPFFLIAVLALFFSPTIVLGGLKTISYLLIILIVPNFVIHIYELYGSIFFKQLLSLGFVILTIGIILSFVNPGFVHLGGRYNGLLGNPNGMGLFVLLITILFEVLYTNNKDEFISQGRIFFLGVAFISIILSGSRTALMGLAIFFVLRYTIRVSRALTFVSLILAVAFIPLIMQYLPLIIQELGLAEFARLDSLQDMSGRAVAFEFSWAQIQNNFWMGKGFGYSEFLFSQWKEYLSDLGHQGGTHNTYLTVWLDTGLFGVLCFVGAWIGIFKKAFSVSSLALPVGCTVIFTTIFESWLSASLNAFTIILLIIVTILTIPHLTNEFEYE